MTGPQDLQEALESMIDDTSLTDVLNALVSVCGDKAEHLLSNWQDPMAAKCWAKMATAIERVANDCIL
jgi:hypothetical protein